MKFIPILFSTEMVNAIVDGRKTMTRRILKLQGCKPFEPDSHLGLDEIQRWNKDYHPFGKVGDVLWVREEHLISFNEAKTEVTIEFKNGCRITKPIKAYSLNLIQRLLKRKTLGKWQRARFMPKEMALVFLERTETSVERLQDISENDAIAEGIERMPKEHWWKNYLKKPLPGTSSARTSFFTLWQSINGEQSLADNPWVWVISFKQINKPENFC